MQDLTAAEELAKEIEQLDEVELNLCIHAVARRYNELVTDREGSFLSLPKDPKARDAELKRIVEFIRICDEKQKAENNPT